MPKQFYVIDSRIVMSANDKRASLSSHDIKLWDQ
jgi:hypothetical protein